MPIDVNLILRAFKQKIAKKQTFNLNLSVLNYFKSDIFCMQFFLIQKFLKKFLQKNGIKSHLL